MAWATWCAAQLAPPAAICHSLPAQGCSQACTQSAAGREAALKSSATSRRLACRGTAGLSQQQQAPLSEAATAPPAQGAVEQPQRGGARPKWAPQAPRSSPGWSFCPGEQSGAPRRPPCPAPLVARRLAPAGFPLEPAHSARRSPTPAASPTPHEQMPAGTAATLASCCSTSTCCPSSGSSERASVGRRCKPDPDLALTAPRVLLGHLRWPITSPPLTALAA